MINSKLLTGKHFGLGFEIYELRQRQVRLSHGGSDKGVQTIFFILPKTNKNFDFHKL
jgi:hypothetical protein